MSEPERSAWVVRHLYTDVDREFTRYLGEMHTLLERCREAGWVDELIHVPISSADDLAARIGESVPGELVVMDLHGHTQEDGAWIGPAPDQAFFDLRCCAPGSWSASAIVLSGCEGTREPFRRELRRINSGHFALIGHWGASRMWDHTAVGVVRSVLDEAEAGNSYAAGSAAQAAVSGSGTREPWVVDHL